MRAKITKANLDGFLAEKREKDVVVFDTEVSGFCVKLTPAGRAVFQCRYRPGGRATSLKTFTIGHYGQLAPDAARKIAQGIIADVRRGIDPMAERAKRAAEEQAKTIKELSVDFLAIHGEVRLKPKSLREYRRAFAQYINPRVGSIPVKALTHGDVEKLHHALRDKPATANRVAAALSKFLSWAIRAGHRPDGLNPVKGLQRFKEKARERYLSRDELIALGNAISACEARKDITPWAAALFRLLLLTGMRRDEARMLRWAAIDFERSRIRLEDSKVGARWLPLPTPTADLLRSISRVEGNPYIFVGKRPGQALNNLSKPWKRVLTEAKIGGLRIHDLRHSAASFGIELGASLPMIGSVLGHASQQTTQRYAHVANDVTSTTAGMIAAHVASMLAPLPQAGKPTASVAPSTGKRALKRRLRIA